MISIDTIDVLKVWKGIWKVMTTIMGSNDASGVLWALGEFFTISTTTWNTRCGTQHQQTGVKYATRQLKTIYYASCIYVHCAC